MSMSSAAREIEGMAKLTEPTNDPALSTVRMALMSDPTKMQHTVVDLTYKTLTNGQSWSQPARSNTPTTHPS